VQYNKWVVSPGSFLQSGKSGLGCVKRSILCLHVKIISDLLKYSCVKMHLISLERVLSLSSIAVDTCWLITLLMDNFLLDMDSCTV